MGTVFFNISYGYHGGQKPKLDEVKKAVEIAQSKDFVEKLENEYNGMVAQGGTNFSGNQKQRLSIARAIARKPEFYIFDDSFSALDYKTDRIFRSRLKEETQGVTTLIIAQRIGTIKDADRILVIKDGDIIESGSHQTLLNKNGFYAGLYNSKLKLCFITYHFVVKRRLFKCELLFTVPPMRLLAPVRLSMPTERLL